MNAREKLIERAWQKLEVLDLAPTKRAQVAAAIVDDFGLADVTGAMQTVLDYHYGRGRFNFSHLAPEERANESFDAWHPIREELTAAIAKLTGEDAP